MQFSTSKYIEMPFALDHSRGAYSAPQTPYPDFLRQLHGREWEEEKGKGGKGRKGERRKERGPYSSPTSFLQPLMMMMMMMTDGR